MSAPARDAATPAGAVGALGGSSVGRWSLRPRGKLWQNPDFLSFWFGRTVSVFGNEITLVALPLTAVLFLDASSVQMGVLRSAGLAPQLLFGLFAGVWVDRLRRRPVLVAADLGRAALLALVPLLGVATLLRIEFLYAVSFAAGVLTVLFTTAYPAYLPWLVGGQHILEANAKLQVSGAVARIAGPGIGGALVQAVGAPLAIILDSATFVVSSASISVIRTREPAPHPKTAHARLLSEVGEGLRFLFANSLLRATTAAAATINFFFNAQQAILMLYLVQEAALSPSVIGLALGVSSIGGLAGAALAGGALPFGFGPTLIVTTLVYGGAGLFVPLSGIMGGPWVVPLLVAGQVVNGLSYPAHFVAHTSLRQSLTPERLQGRVTASYTTVAWGIQPIGALVGGVLGGVFGLHAVLMVSGLGMLAAHLWLLFSPIARLREIPEPAERLPVAR